MNMIMTVDLIAMEINIFLFIKSLQDFINKSVFWLNHFIVDKYIPIKENFFMNKYC